MATSSIFENFLIKNEIEAERFVKALEASEKEPNRIMTSIISEPVTDSKKICELFGVSETK